MQLSMDSENEQMALQIERYNGAFQLCTYVLQPSKRTATINPVDIT